MDSKKKLQEKADRRAQIIREARLTSMFFVRKELEKALRDLAGMKLDASDEAFVVNLACVTLRKEGVSNDSLLMIAERILANVELHKEGKTA